MKRIIAVLLFVLIWSLFAAPAGMGALSPDYQDPSGRYEKLAVSGNTLRMGFKNVVFTQGGMLQAVQVYGRQVLSAPMAAAIAANGKSLPLKNESFKLSKVGGNAVLAQGIQSFAGGQLVTEFRIGWDHTLVAEVTLEPTAPLFLDSLTLRFPMNLAQGEKLLCGVNEPPNRRLSGLDANRTWLRLNITEDEPIFCSAWNNLWLGNTRHGLAWSFEEIGDWHTSSGKEICFTPKDNLLCFRLIDRKTEVKKPLRYRFFLNITPMAKMQKGWRNWRISTRYNNLTKLPGDKLIYWSFWRPGTRETHNSAWVFDPERMKEIAAADAAAGKARMFYFIPSHYSWSTLAEKDGVKYLLVDPELEAMTGRALCTPDYSFRFKETADVKRITSLEEWKQIFGKNPPVTTRAGERVCRLTPELVERNLSVVDHFVRDFNIPGIYSDGVAPKADFTPGIGTKDDSGALRPAYATQAYRDMYKRIRAVVAAKDPKNGLMIAHNSSIRFMPSLAFFDFILFGEDFFYWYQEPEKRDASPDGDFYYAHIWGDIDNLKTEYHRQYGMPQVLLPELRGANRKVFPAPKRGTRTMLCYSIQFDMLYWALHCDASEIQKFDAIRAKFNTGGNDTEQVEFVPYWENKRFLADKPEVKVGYYEKHASHDPYMPEAKPQAFLLMVSNPQFAPADFKVRIPSELQNVKVFDRQANKPMTIDQGGTVTLSLKEYDFTVLEVTADE